MHEDHAMLVQTFGKGGTHIVLAKILHEGIFRQDRQRREFGQHVAEHGQEHVMDLRRDFLENPEVLPIVWTKTAQRENAKETSASKEHQQSRSERPTRYRIAEKDH